MFRRQILGAGAAPLVALAGLQAGAQTPPSAILSGAAGPSPDAGRWRTWVLARGDELRRPPPPDGAATEAELAELRLLLGGRDAGTLARMAHWDAGSPSYRWNEVAVREAIRGGLTVPHAARQLALLNAALADAMVATWDSKHAYRRPRPSAVDTNLTTALPTPASPSYPSEHAAAAGAAAEVLAFLFPDGTGRFRAMAEEAARSRLLAGLHYPSDVAAGLALGRAVGERAVAQARARPAELAWSGTVPTGPGRWRGENPILPAAATWPTWVLARPDELRPPPPPAHDSERMAAELAELRTVRRSPPMTVAAHYWEYGAGAFRAFALWTELIGRKLFEHRRDADPPWAARAYAVAMIAFNDATVACWDAKYAYWATRPSQLDPGLRPLFPPPNHPSYPAGHAAVTTAVATALAALFPADAAEFEAMAEEAAESRAWAGIHFRSDLDAGRDLGRDVAERVLAAALAEPQP